MNVDRRAVGLGMCIGGIVLWVAALIVDAPLVSIVLSILILMGGALMLVTASAGGK